MQAVKTISNVDVLYPKHGLNENTQALIILGYSGGTLYLVY